MDKLKKYPDFLILEKDWLIRKIDKNQDPSQSKQLSIKTDDLFQIIFGKIEEENSLPVYIYNTVDFNESFYVIGELFENHEKIGASLDESGFLITSNGKYSYCILNASKENISLGEIENGIFQIASKNSSNGVKTIIEISNFSSLSESNKSGICSVIESRRIEELVLKNGEFFILTDNKNSKKGGKNLGESIQKYFPKSNIEVYLHEFSGD